jgi:hypothetical protein
MNKYKELRYLIRKRDNNYETIKPKIQNKYNRDITMDTLESVEMRISLIRNHIFSGIFTYFFLLVVPIILIITFDYFNLRGDAIGPVTLLLTILIPVLLSKLKLVDGKRYGEE